MNTYITLLRGINVSGKKIIKMDNLRKCFEELEFSNVRTYIQSGNVVFYFKNIPLELLSDRIAKNILNNFGFEVPVLVLTKSELTDIIKNNPFLKDKLKDIDRMYFTLLQKEPLKENIELLSTCSFPPEEYVLSGKTIYFYSPFGYGNAKMNNNFFESKLKVFATTRNLKTMMKISELCGK